YFRSKSPSHLLCVCGITYPSPRTLPSNTVPNPEGEMKVVTTRSGLAYEGPSIPTESPLEKVDEQNTEEILDKEHSNSLGSTAQVQPPVMPILIPEPDVSRAQPKPTIPYPFRLNDQKLREKATNQMEKFFQIFHDFHFDISFADALLLMPKFASTIKSLIANKDKLFELAKVPLNENCSAMLLKKLSEKLGDPELTPTRMTLELADRSITRPKGVAEDVFVKVGKFHVPTDFVVVDFEADPRVPLILEISFLRTGCALIDVYGEDITLRYNPKSRSPTLVSDDLISESDSSKEPIVKSSSPTLTSFGERGIIFLKKLLNEDPFQLPPMDVKLAEESKAKSFVEKPPELDLKELPSHLEMSPKRNSASAASASDALAMNQAAIKQLVVDSVAAALKAQAANMANADNTNRNPEPREAPVARKCSYKQFMSCQPFNFKDYKVKFATGTLTKEALSWWNSFAQPIGIEEAYKLSSVEFKKLLIKKYCPRTEVQKMEDEFYHLTVKGNDLNTYVRIFQELATLCPTIVSDSEKMIEAFIGGLP
nr:reverse transcriptase domain-containing protein [Tanacetum cinerariifolium]